MSFVAQRLPLQQSESGFHSSSSSRSGSNCQPSIKINHVVGHLTVRAEHLPSLIKLLSSAALDEKIVNVRRQSNFIVIKDTYYTYNVFTHSGHVNVYRIRDLESHLDGASIRFCSLFSNGCIGDSKPTDLLISPNVVIVNISAAGIIPAINKDDDDDCDNAPIDLYRAKCIYESTRGENAFFSRLTYNPDIYAALSCKSKIGGTANIFTSRSITILGAKSEAALIQIYSELCAFIQTL